MLDDFHSDQMLNHHSIGWTRPMMGQLHEQLTQHAWTCTFTNNNDYALYKKNHKRLTVSLTHNPPDDLCDYYIGDAVTPWRDFELWPEIFGVYQHDFVYTESVPTKEFNCFINRGCGIRQSWFYFLERHRLIDQGHVSFWCKDRINRPKLSAQEYSELLFQTHNRPMFEVEHLRLQGQIPYKNFTLPLEQAIIDSHRSLVIETFFHPNHHITYSEKTWRAIQLPRPALWFSSQHAVKHLRDWGFDVWDDVVDHAYDNEPNQFVRQQMILSQLVKPIKYHADEWEERAQHNRNLLKSYRHSWPDKYKKIINNLATISNTESLT